MKLFTQLYWGKNNAYAKRSALHFSIDMREEGWLEVEVSSFVRIRFWLICTLLFKLYLTGVVVT